MAQTDFVEGCGRPISHISPKMMQVKRVCTMRVVIKVPMVHLIRVKGDRRKRAKVMVEEEDGHHMSQKEGEERLTATHRPPTPEG